MRTDQAYKKSQKKLFGGESLKERIHRHLKDLSSEITDEDIRNVAIEFEIATEIDSAFYEVHDEGKLLYHSAL
jgi:predicted short-subunit dehydrogenase-like oxidoreductase (DUF2520 family)